MSFFNRFKGSKNVVSNNVIEEQHAVNPNMENLWESTKNQITFDVEIETLKHLDSVCWFSD